MRIIFFTSSMTSSDYRNLLLSNGLATNPSNQNFHRNLIRALASKMPINVFSTAVLRTNGSLIHTNEEDMVTYTYLSFHSNRLLKPLTLKRTLFKNLNELDLKNEEVLFVIDSLNYSLSHLARKYAKKHNIKTLGIISDNPNLISNMPTLNKKLLLASLKKYDTYLCLTNGLKALASVGTRPCLILEGCYDPTILPAKIKKQNPYIFFGGALYEKYGVKDLIDSYLRLDSSLELIIAGHGPLKEYIYQKTLDNCRIKFVGVLSQAEIYQYEKNAALCINPRPFSEEFDRYSIPSKVIEYVASGTPTLSIKHTRLMEIFKDSVHWLDTNTDLEKGITCFLQENAKEHSAKALRAKQIAYENFSIDAVGLVLYDFIRTFIN